MYKLTRVTKDYRKGPDTVHALAGVDVVIEDGEWLAIQGPTGHGKTTLLQILGALDRPTSGVAEFDGRDLATLRETELAKVRATSVGFIFQTFNLIPTLSAQENVETALAPLGVTGADRRARAAEALAGVGLAERLNTCRRNCPAGSSNGWPSPGPWSSSPRCCWPTSPPATSTKPPATRSSPCWKPSGANAA